MGSAHKSGRAVQVRAQAGARHVTLTVLLSTQVYK